MLRHGKLSTIAKNSRTENSLFRALFQATFSLPGKALNRLKFRIFGKGNVFIKAGIQLISGLSMSTEHRGFKIGKITSINCQQLVTMNVCLQQNIC